MKFEDAQALARQHPATFDCPDAVSLAALKVGDTVKVCIEGERFWTIIQQIEGDVITARIDNDLQYTDRHGLRCDDVIRFEVKNIYQIWNDIVGHHAQTHRY